MIPLKFCLAMLVEMHRNIKKDKILTIYIE